jgi:RecB family exonuclease
MEDKMSKKLLALDIDGTLTNTQKDITPATLEKIIEAQEKGHIVAIASGRPLPGIRKIADTIELDRFGGYVLAFNGGRIVDYSTGEVVYQAVLDNDVVRDIPTSMVSSLVSVRVRSCLCQWCVNCKKVRSLRQANPLCTTLTSLSGIHSVRQVHW